MSNSPLMVGYLESWSNLSITNAAEAGYTGIVLAFGSIAETTVQVYQDAFPPDNGSDGKVDLSLLQADISGAMNAGAKQVLISCGGGQNNTYNPGSASAKDVAQAVVSFVQSAGFTGCDFDLEISTDGTYLQSLLQEIRNLDGALSLTAAPQINQVANGQVQFVTTGFDTDYNPAVAAGLFDYLFPQAYCTGGYEIAGQSESDVGFISAAFEYIVANLVPPSTLVAIGEPADSSAAGCAVNIYAGSPGSGIYAQIADQYQSIVSKAQFGGAMAWDVNNDESNGYAFVEAVGPVLAKA